MNSRNSRQILHDRGLLLRSRRVLSSFASILLITCTSALLGCGGSDSTTGPAGGGGNGGGGIDGGGVPGTPVSAAERLASLGAAEAELRRLAGSGSRYEPASMLAFLAKQKVFSKVGYNEKGSSAWAVYTDGRMLMIANDPPESAPAALSTGARATSPARATADEGDPLLTEPQFRSVNTWTCLPLMDYVHVTEDWVDDDTVPRLSRIAAGLGCEVVDEGVINDGFERERIADVEGLKNVTGDGVLLITAFGGHGEIDGMSVSAIRTLTPAVLADDLNLGYEADLDSLRLVYFIAPPCVETGDETPLTCLGITPEFVRHYNWSFPKGSLVYLNTTGNTLPDFMGPIEARGAHTVLGWEGSAHRRTMLGAAQDFFELMFATNHIGSSWDLEIEPRLRNYGLGGVYPYMLQQGLLEGVEVDGRAGRLQLFESYDGGFVGQIRPSIEYLVVLENTNEVQLQGHFGDNPGQVFIGSQTESPTVPELYEVADPALTGGSSDAAAIIEWLPNVITVKLPSARDAGMLQVRVDNRYSNVAHLTKWTPTFQITRTVGGTLQRSVTMEVEFRAFVGGYRLWPDQPIDVQWPLLPVFNMTEGSIGWSASGSLSSTQGTSTTTVSWSGAGNFNINNGLDEFFMLNGVIRVPQRRMECTITMYKALGLHVVTENVSPNGTSTVEEDKYFGVKTPSAQPPISWGSVPLNFDENWVLQAGNVIFSDNDESVLGRDDCQTQITWQRVEPQFPPEMTRGGR